MVGIKQNFNSPAISQKRTQKDASFGNGALLSALASPVVTTGLNYLNNNPMQSIAVLDVLSCIGPRTATDTVKLNPVAGSETMARESSGLLLNCYFPGLAALGAAKFLQWKNSDITKHGILPEKIWANTETINKYSEEFKKALASPAKLATLNENDSVLHNFYTNLLDTVKVSYGNEETAHGTLSEAKDDIAKTFVELSKNQELTHFDRTSMIGKISNALGGHAENIKAVGIGTNLERFVNDAHSLGHAFAKAGAENHDAVVKSLNKFALSKTIGAFAVTLPIAVSIQTGLRMLTRKRTGKEGAPIYKDFGKDGVEHKVDKNEKKKLILGKILASTALIGISALTIGKEKLMSLKEIGKLAQFKSPMTSMDQCRFVSTATFVSRFWAAEDSNELKGSALRDIFGFTSLYVLGEFVQKGIVHAFGKGKDLVHDTDPLKSDSGVIDKVKHAFRGWSTKNQNEVIFETLNKAGLDISTIEDGIHKEGFFKKGSINLKKVTEEILTKPNGQEIIDTMKKRLKVLNGAQLFSLGFSTALLGIIIPHTMIKITEHNEKKRKARLAADGITEQPVPQQSNQTNMMGTAVFSDKSKELFKAFVAKNNI